MCHLIYFSLYSIQNLVIVVMAFLALSQKGQNILLFIACYAHMRHQIQTISVRWIGVNMERVLIINSVMQKYQRSKSYNETTMYSIIFVTLTIPWYLICDVIRKIFITSPVVTYLALSIYYVTQECLQVKAWGSKMILNFDLIQHVISWVNCEKCCTSDEYAVYEKITGKIFDFLLVFSRKNFLFRF